MHEENTLAQLNDVATRAERVALMADGHLGYVMPIGGVAAYDNRSPSWASGSTSPAATRRSAPT